MQRLLPCALLLMIPSLVSAQDSVQQVLLVRAGIGPAMRAKDTTALEHIWSPEMKVNSPGNKVIDRETVLKLLREDHIKYSAFKDVIEATSIFKDTVILMGHEELTEAVGPDAGKPKIRRYTDVWQRNSDGGAWMLIGRQATYIATP